MSDKNESLTTAPVSVPEITTTAKSQPEFIRYPKPRTRCEKTNLSRTRMCELVLPCAANDFKPPVRSVVLRKKGKDRGIRLIDFASLMAYLNSSGLAVAKEGNHEA
jgi:hypothetical protein